MFQCSMFTTNKEPQMETTDRDYADKSWLDHSDDGFQLITPDFAIFLLICGGFVGYVFRGWL